MRPSSTPLRNAVYNDNYEAVKLLIDAGAKWDASDDYYFLTQWRRNMNRPPEYQNKRINTARGNILALLLSNGVDLSTQDQEVIRYYLNAV